MTLDPATHDYAAEEEAITAHVEAMHNGGEPILYFGAGPVPRGAIAPFSAEGGELPYGGVPPQAPELTATFTREDWQLLYETVTAALEDGLANGLEHRRLEQLDTLQENLSQLVDPEHG